MYQVLARKWRPQNFATLIGQEHVKQALVNALEKQRIHHAYLFTGTRGVGKTTIARIIAKCLNCETGITADPCGTCSTCQAIEQGHFPDLLEVDAASKTKVDDTRELLDNVPYAPTQGRYKIYLIDEVHMLSGHSFNALLKTLEEPPEHVKFLLATTDPQKLPATILSRCLQFHLKNLLPEVIAEHLANILKSENLTFEMGAVNALSFAANGSMRDAVSLLDQAISYCANTQLMTTDVNAMLGLIGQDAILQLLQRLAQADLNRLLDLCQEFTELGVDFHHCIDSLLTALHDIAICQALPQQETINPNIANLAQQFSREDIQLFYQIAIQSRHEIALSPSAKIGFEMMLLRMLNFSPALAALMPKLTASASKPSKHVSEPAATVDHNPTQSKEKVVTQSTPIAKPPSSQVNWADITNNLALAGPSKVLANHCELISLDDTQIHLQIDANHQALINDNSQTRLEKALQAALTTQAKLLITPSTTVSNTPAAQQQQARLDRQHQAAETLQKDPQMQAILSTFDAKLDPRKCELHNEVN